VLGGGQTLLQADFSPADMVNLSSEAARLEARLLALQRDEAALRAQNKQLEAQPPDAALAG
jgi:hypothetical protein